jgi:hypothetical protein
MPTIKRVARHNWSGVERLDFEFPRSELDRIIDFIPVTRTQDQAEAQNRLERLSIALNELKARFQRHLHQDEFGTRRPDQAEALRALIAKLEEPADQVDEARFDWIVSILEATDINATAELFDDASALGLDLSALRDELLPEEQERKLALLRQALQRTIDRLSNANGPSRAKSVPVLIAQLATLWKQETGLEPTPSGERSYRTDFENFALAVATAFLPTEEWCKERKYLRAPGHRNKFAPGRIDASVLQAVREIRKTGSSRPGRPPRG